MFQASEDLDFNYRLLRSGRIAYVTPEIRSVHRQWRRTDDLGPLLKNYMAGNCGLAMKQLRTGDVVGGMWTWGGVLKHMLRYLKIAISKRSMLHAQLCVYQMRGFVTGTVKGFAQSW